MAIKVQDDGKQGHLEVDLSNTLIKLDSTSALLLAVDGDFVYKFWMYDT